MMPTPAFRKYTAMGAYHWEQVRRSPFKRNSFVVGRYRNCLSLVREACGGKLDGKRILDIGCGDGVLAGMLAARGAVVTGIDSSELAIDFARVRLPGVHFDIGDAAQLPYTEGSFDIVVSSDVIEHLADPAAMLREARRVVTSHGAVIISTPIRFTERPLDPNHVQEWFPGEFMTLVCGVFPNVEHRISHPLFWMELFTRSRIGAFLVNLLSFVKDPFTGTRSSAAGFRYYALQYAVCRKEPIR